MALKPTPPTGMPRSFSSSVTASSSRRRWCTLSVLVMNRADKPGRTAASKSGMASLIGRLMRTATSAPPRTTFFIASGSIDRASGFCAGWTLSSRSTSTQSAPRSCARSTNFATLPGT
jgi:hypothetical protein